MREVVLPLAGTQAGRVQLATGAGGDRTMELDHAAEVVVFEELDRIAASGEGFSILSEEAGLRTLGSEYPLVLVDPVDGSLNAKQGVPFFGIMLALLDGPAVGDAYVASVVNLVNGETWTAIRKQGAAHAGVRLEVMPRQDPDRIELVALESTPRSLRLAQGLVESATKLRVLGSMALAIAHTAAGAFDVFCAPVPMRVFDMTASLLILSEAGGVATDIKGRAVGPLTCRLETRSSLVCSPNAEMHAGALRALAGDR